jgi:hypothetical protein
MMLYVNEKRLLIRVRSSHKLAPTMHAAHRRRAAKPNEYNVAPLHLVAVPPHTPAFDTPGFERFNSTGINSLK